MVNVVGVGARRGVAAAEVYEAVSEVLREAGVSPRDVAWLATVDARATEPGVLVAARCLGLALRSYSPDILAKVEVPNPSEAALCSAGTPSVAEAAALLAAGEGARLLVAKRKPAVDGEAGGPARPARPARVTVAVAGERHPRPYAPERFATQGDE